MSTIVSMTDKYGITGNADFKMVELHLMQTFLKSRRSII